MKEIGFNNLKKDFDTICKTVNEENETLTLKLKSNRKVYILPEENYNAIQKFNVILSPQPFHR